MSILSPITRSLGTITDRIICIVFAIVFAQAPVYMAQYIDVLSGAQMESQKLYEDLVERASKYELTIDEFLERLKANPDVLVKENAEASESAVNRYRNYTEALNALLESSVWNKPFRLIKYYDPSVNAAIQFEPNVPLTWEGIIYAFIGLVLALVIIGLFSSLWNALFKKKKDITENVHS
ncbi:MAG: DUF2937 family protein [Bacteroidia bacterium]